MSWVLLVFCYYIIHMLTGMSSDTTTASFLDPLALRRKIPSTQGNSSRGHPLTQGSSMMLSIEMKPFRRQVHAARPRESNQDETIEVTAIAVPAPNPSPPVCVSISHQRASSSLPRKCGTSRLDKSVLRSDVATVYYHIMGC